MKLTPERNRLIPGPFRDQHGWYEEDSELAIIHRYFADECADEVDDVQRLEARAEQAVRDQLPTEWEQVNGRELNPGESVRKDRESWTAGHKSSFVSRAVEAAESNPDLVVVTAFRTADGVEAQYLVPRAEYRAAQHWGERGSNRRMAIDPARHPMLP